MKKMRRRRERRKWDKDNAETDYINELKEGRAVMGEERIWIEYEVLRRKEYKIKKKGIKDLVDLKLHRKQNIIQDYTKEGQTIRY